MCNSHDKHIFEKKKKSYFISRRANDEYNHLVLEHISWCWWEINRFITWSFSSSPHSLCNAPPRFSPSLCFFSITMDRRLSLLCNHTSLRLINGEGGGRGGEKLLNMGVFFFFYGAFRPCRLIFCLCPINGGWVFVSVSSLLTAHPSLSLLSPYPLTPRTSTSYPATIQPLWNLIIRAVVILRCYFFFVLLHPTLLQIVWSLFEMLHLRLKSFLLSEGIWTQSGRWSSKITQHMPVFLFRYYWYLCIKLQP